METYFLRCCSQHDTHQTVTQKDPIRNSVFIFLILEYQFTWRIERDPTEYRSVAAVAFFMFATFGALLHYMLSRMRDN